MRASPRRRVVMLLAKEITYDARVQRAASSLAAEGYDVEVVCRAPFGLPSHAVEDGYRIRPVAIPPLPEEPADPEVELLRVVTRRRRFFEEPAIDYGQQRALKHREAELRARTAAVSMLRERGMFVDARYRAAWDGLLRLDARDVVHVHDEHGLATALGVRANGTKVVYDAHEHVLGKGLSRRRGAALGEYLRLNAPRADVVITIGSALAAVLERQLELRTSPAVVHNTPSMRHAKPARYDLRAALGLGPRTPLLVYTGSVTKRRRLSTPITALARLPGVHLALVLLAGEDARQLLETAGRHGVADRVHVVAPVPHDELVSLIQSADAGVHPLERYGNGDVAMPNKLFEFMHAGLPMVVSDAPEMARFVREHRLGEVCPVEDTGAWASAIRRVLGDPDAYRAGPELRRRWCWEAEESVLLELYERLLAGRNGA